MKHILRKELKEFIFNYRAWIGAAVIAAAPRFFAYHQRELGAPVFVSLMLMALCQYLFQSYLADTSSGGAVFFHNMGAGFAAPLVAKLLFAMAGAAVIFLVNVPFVRTHLRAWDAVWLVPLCVASNAWMMLTVVAARGSEMTSGLLSTGMIFAGVFGLFLLDSLWLRAGITTAAALLLVRLASCAFNSLRYRTQL